MLLLEYKEVRPLGSEPIEQVVGGPYKTHTIFFFESVRSLFPPSSSLLRGYLIPATRSQVSQQFQISLAILCCSSDLYFNLFILMFISLRLYISFTLCFIWFSAHFPLAVNLHQFSTISLDLPVLFVVVVGFLMNNEYLPQFSTDYWVNFAYITFICFLNCRYWNYLDNRVHVSLSLSCVFWNVLFSSFSGLLLYMSVISENDVLTYEAI